MNRREESDLKELRAACDESYNPNTVLVIAGYMGEQATWDKLSAEWDEILQEAEVPEIHMNNLVARTGDFKSWSWERSRHVQDQVLRALMFSNLRGYATVLSLSAWDAIGKEAKALRPQGYHHPFLFVVQHQLEFMGGGLKSFLGYDVVRFLLDENSEFGGRMSELRESLHAHGGPGDRALIGPVEQGRSAARFELQAADVLAYEVRRHFESSVYGHHSERERPDAWKAVSALNLEVNHFPNGVMPKVLEALKKDRARRSATTKGSPKTKADGK